MSETPGRAAEAVARQSYARLIAFLAARTRDLAAAEDALADAFRAALETWPRDGVPRSPEAWLLTTARRSHGARRRRDARGEALLPDLVLALEDAEAQAEEADEAAFPDHRLKLLFACAHPAIDPTVRTPLMLQCVLGLDAGRIAAAFLVPPATMGQRLVRAKAKIKAARIRFATPEAEDLPGRLAAVLEAIFGAFGAGWDAFGSEDGRHRGLAGEAIFLARMLAQMMPEEPEVLGLLALMLHGEARAAARRDRAGGYVALGDQDTGLWDAARIDEVDALVRRAGGMGRFGRFQCAGAIQAVHAARRITGRTDAAALDLLYGALVIFSPTVGVRVAQAAARAEVAGPAAGLALLDALPEAGRGLPALLGGARRAPRADGRDRRRVGRARPRAAPERRPGGPRLSRECAVPAGLTRPELTGRTGKNQDPRGCGC